MRRVLHFLVLLAAVVGGPALLITVASNPVPDDMSSLQGFQTLVSGSATDALLIGGLAILGWLVWLAFTLSVLLEILARLTRLPVLLLPGLGSPQRAAAFVLSGIVGSFSTSQAIAAAPAAPIVATAAPTPGQDDQPEAERELDSRPTTRVRVQRGDTLWSLAQKHLGDGRRYTEIFELNKDLLQPDGRVLRDENRVLEGWTLMIPASSAPEDDVEYEVHRVRQGDTLWDIAEQRLGDGARYAELVSASKRVAQPSGRHLEDPDEIYPGWTIRIPIAADRGEVKPVASVEDVEPPKQVEPPPCSQSDEVEDRTETPTTNAVGSVVNVGAVFGYGAFLAAAVMSILSYRRLRQRRREQADVDQAQLPVEEDLCTVQDPDAVSFVDRALRTVRAALARGRQPIPELSAARYTEQGLELHLARPYDPPAAIEALDPTTWLVATDAVLLAPELAAETAAPYPALVTLGHDAAGNPVMVDLEHVRDLGLCGEPESVRDVLRALALELAASPWTDDMTITAVGFGDELPNALRGKIGWADSLDDILDELEDHAETVRAALAASELQSLGHARIRDEYGDAWTPQIVLCSRELTRTQRERLAAMSALEYPAVAVVTWEETDDVLPAPWQLDAGDDLTSSGPLPWPIRLQRVYADDYQQIITALQAADDEPAEADEPEPTELIQGPAVRILGPIAVDGAEGKLEPNKRGQLTELLVYLALHPGATPDAVSQALWPERDIRPTTRNTAMSKLRTWLGKDEHGQEYLPTVTGGTAYRLSPAVYVDWHEFQTLADKGLGEPGPRGTVALQRAMDLVRGQPFQDVPLRRYAWISADRGNMITTIACVAHELAKRKLAEGKPAEARRVLAKARTVRSTSEAIWCDLAQLEASVGNYDALRRLHDAYLDECESHGIQPDPETLRTFDRSLTPPAVCRRTS